MVGIRRMMATTRAAVHRDQARRLMRMVGAVRFVRGGFTRCEAGFRSGRLAGQRGAFWVVCCGGETASALYAREGESGWFFEGRTRSSPRIRRGGGRSEGS